MQVYFEVFALFDVARVQKVFKQTRSGYGYLELEELEELIEATDTVTDGISCVPHHRPC